MVKWCADYQFSAIGSIGRPESGMCALAFRQQQGSMRRGSQERENIFFFFFYLSGYSHVENNRSEEVIQYRRMLQQCKNKFQNVIVSGILPRATAPTCFYDGAFRFRTTNRLRYLHRRCQLRELWDDFYNKPCLFQEDGLHLHKMGAAQLGKPLSNKV